LLISVLAKRYNTIQEVLKAERDQLNLAHKTKTNKTVTSTWLLSISSVMPRHVMAVILGLIEPEIGLIVPFDPPTQKTLP